MNGISLLAIEWLKQKRSVLPWLVVGGPLAVAGMIYLDLYLRYDYLLREREGFDSWEIMLGELWVLWSLFFPAGITLVAALVHYREYDADAWKHLLALPASRTSIYIGKWLFIWLLSCLAVIHLFICLFIAGVVIGFPEPFAFRLFASYGFHLAAAAFGVTSLQHWLSSRCKNPVFPVSIGITGSIGAIFLAQSEFARFIPYAFPLLAMPLENPYRWIAVTGGCVTGAVMLAAGWAEFSKRDIV
ncbi:hypothetical protein BSNK01_21200 [Bacillaceae bacterium]